MASDGRTRWHALPGALQLAAQLHDSVADGWLADPVDRASAGPRRSEED